jgi:hypothetical protein
MTAVIADAAIAAPAKAQGMGRNRPGGVWINAGLRWGSFKAKVFAGAVERKFSCALCSVAGAGERGKNRSIADKVVPGLLI